MRPVLLVGLDPRQRFPQELSGPFRIEIAGEQYPFGERQLVAITAGQHVQMNMRHRVEGNRTVVQRDIGRVAASLPRRRTELAAFPACKATLGPKSCVNGA